MTVKTWLLFVPLLIGLMLIGYSWFLNYPLSIHSANESIFKNISIYYWFGLSLALPSIFLITINFKNEYVRWIMVVIFVLALYSLSYFYFTLPTSDSHFFRGLSRNFLTTNNLEISQNYQSYYQWPAFFILAKIVTLITGLDLITYEFLLFTIIGVLACSLLYIYGSKLFNQSSFIAVMAFFLIAYTFLNFQAVPFMLAFVLLLFLFSLDLKRVVNIIIMLVLFACTVLTHAFVPFFFLLYLFVRSVIDRGIYIKLFFLTIQIYLLIQIMLNPISFSINLIQVFNLSSEYSGIVTNTLAPVYGPIDFVAQLFIRIVTIGFGILSIIGFLGLMIKKQLRKLDKVIFITGIIYSCLGIFLFALGSRAIPIVIIPVSLGLIFLYRSKFKPYLIFLIVILMALAVFLPVRSATNDYPITFQTKDDMAAANFVIEKYNWAVGNIAISDSGAKWYISPQIKNDVKIDTNFESRYGLENITDYDCIIYSIGLEKALLINKISVERTSQEIFDDFNIIYNTGLSYIAVKST